MNLATNCIRYSDNNKAKFLIYVKEHTLHVDIINSGKVINEQEKQFLFQHFFRGENSKEKRGLA